jgi:hypothetical protein
VVDPDMIPQSHMKKFVMEGGARLSNRRVSIGDWSEGRSGNGSIHPADTDADADADAE